MRLTAVKPDDIFLCDVRGDVFYALVMGEPDQTGLIPIASLIPSRPIPALRVKSRQVTGHWRRTPRTPPPSARLNGVAGSTARS